MGTGLKPNPHYTLASWAGHTQWKCNYCQYDTLEGEQDILVHIATRHFNPLAPKPSIIPIADKRGNEIK
jgi:hypothetical protein